MNSGPDMRDAQRRHWQTMFQAHPHLYGTDPSAPGAYAVELFGRERVGQVLELGAGQGRDTLAFLRAGVTGDRARLRDPGAERPAPGRRRGRSRGPPRHTRARRAGPAAAAPSQLWELVRRLAAMAGIAGWERLSAHSLRHTAITTALDAGVPLRDVQDYARHRDARTTRRYDHSRDSLDRNAAYAVAAHLA
jgi:integrase/recombinase XerD